MDVLMECCCGLDVHRDMVEACIIKGMLETPEMIREQFKTTRQDLIRLTKWLVENECYHIAMESTGVYWRPVYESIEEHSEKYYCMMVVNAHHMRNLPGRKSDVKDAEWIATLMRHGMLEASFVPDRLIRDMREFSRLRRNLVKEKCRHSNHLEKFLQTHGFKLSSVLSDILCVSGRNLLNTLAQKGILTTEDVIANVRGKTKFSKEEIAIAVCGSINPAEQKLLQLLLKRIDEDNATLKEVEQAMEDLFAPYAKEVDIVDSIPGIDKITAMTILSEISVTPKNSFPTSGHLTKWAGLVPRNDESAEKVKSRKILPGNQYIKTILCQAAWSAVRVRNSSFAKWFWSHQGHKGQKKAIIAISRKLLEMVYILLKRGTYYDPNYALRPKEYNCKNRIFKAEFLRLVPLRPFILTFLIGFTHHVPSSYK